ncbi:glycoside hydrolase family 16 protein [Glaciecola sp. XM2]|jgi:beta-glucanase (GH16 family)|uniref:glycoside hydrolase family 16 protein n=1 Tax=Glaciecola sp. XM2 TaxID=1914931 RepID=UPI001BDE7B82|nr:glycoside hydrolase family 16 protein [Glaciecola sp. XM2]MBT1449352.1 glycoside hydrolase family 16 protein [Glaciecola sp. XM2]
MTIHNKWALIAIATGATLTLSGCQNDDEAIGGTLENPPAPTSAAYELVWADEFDGNAVDLTKWEIQLGDGSSVGLPGGWGNNERQYYTADNISVEDGLLVIEARAGDSPDPDFDFTSGRLRTQGLFDFTYGRIEASIQTPAGLGMWPAFWTLGSDPSPFGVWAARGEIDIMESFGQATPFIAGTVHFGQRFPLNERVGKNFDIDPSEGFNQYAVEWDSQRIRWFVNGEHYFTVSRETYWNYYFENQLNGFVSGAEDAPFNENQHIILNLAVGGNPTGTPNPNDTDVFPGQMLVDYVRVYQCPLAPVSDGLGCENSIDQVDPFIITQGGDGTPPPQDVVITEFNLYNNGTGALFPDSNSERQLNIGVFDNSGALTVEEVESSDADRGLVIEIETTGGGNIQINDLAGGTFELFGVGNANDNEFFGGELKFEVFVDSANTTATALQVGVDSGFPDVGFVQVPLTDIALDQWTTVSLALSDVIQGNRGAFGGNPLNIEEVVNLIILEPVGGAARMQFDNIRWLCGAPQSRPCGIVSVTTVPQNVFIDSVDPLFDFGIGAVDSGSGFATYTDGTNPDGVNKIEWEIITDADAARDQVIEITFNGDGENGVWFIATDPIDLSSYNNGAVVFDLFVTDIGSDTNTITMQIDCVFPCTSGPQDLGSPAEGEWIEIEIPLAQLIGSGLNTASVSAGLVLATTDVNATAVFSIDNVRWEPTTDIEEMETPPLQFFADFEGVDPEGGTLGGNWQSFGTVFNAAGDFVYNYGAPFATPLSDVAFANITTDQGGDAQGERQLVLFNDYNNADHNNGLFIEAATFQQVTLTANDNGVYTFRFDARAPDAGAIESPTTAKAYVQTLDPANGFATTGRVEIDLSMITSTEWQTYSVDFAINGETMAGQLLEFGFSNRTTGFAASGIVFDNVGFNVSTGGISYTGNFEGLDASAGEIGDGWNSFVAVFNSAGDFAYGYGPFPSPNGTGNISQIASGEEGPDQGTQYLNAFSDYGNVDHGNGFLIEALTFQERTFPASAAGTYTFAFDAKAPSTGGIEAPTTAFAFIRTLDPNNSFGISAEVRLDMTDVSNTDWARFSLELALGENLDGHILQFGFSNSATAFNPSGIYYDNVDMSRAE